MYTPPKRIVRWPFSAFATVVMIVVPIFWPVLAVIFAFELLGLVVWTVLFVGGNAILLTVLLCALLVRASRRRQPRPSHPGR